MREGGTRQTISGSRSLCNEATKAPSSPVDAMRAEIGVGVARRPENNVTPLYINIFINPLKNKQSSL